jgi:hypothetical protein
MEYGLARSQGFYYEVAGEGLLFEIDSSSIHE